MNTSIVRGSKLPKFTNKWRKGTYYSKMPNCFECLPSIYNQKGQLTTTKYIDFVYSSYHGKLTQSTCLQGLLEVISCFRYLCVEQLQMKGQSGPNEV